MASFVHLYMALYEVLHKQGFDFTASFIQASPFLLPIACSYVWNVLIHFFLVSGLHEHFLACIHVLNYADVFTIGISS